MFGLHDFISNASAIFRSFGGLKPDDRCYNFLYSKAIVQANPLTAPNSCNIDRKIHKWLADVSRHVNGELLK